MVNHMAIKHFLRVFFLLKNKIRINKKLTATYDTGNKYV